MLNKQRKQQGISLIESMLALLVISIDPRVDGDEQQILSVEPDLDVSQILQGPEKESSADEKTQ